jgi:hypothetical protein
MLTRVSKVLMFMFLGVGGSMALGQGVNPATTPTNTSHLLYLSPSQVEGVNIWSGFVGSTTSYTPVELDPVGPAWTKHLQTNDGSPIAATVARIAVVERLHVTGPYPWTGWHSELDPGFRWNGVLDVTMQPPFAMTVNGVTSFGNYHVSGSTLDVTFPAISPGTDVTLGFMFGWSDSVPFTGSLQMREYPTPEPATLILMALAGSGVLRRRPRRIE